MAPSLTKTTPNETTTTRPPPKNKQRRKVSYCGLVWTVGQLLATPAKPYGGVFFGGNNGQIEARTPGLKPKELKKIFCLLLYEYTKL